MPMTIERVREIAKRVVEDWRDRNMEEQFQECGDWTRVQNHWMGWDDGIQILTREEFLEEKGRYWQAEEAPDDFVAYVASDPMYPAYVGDEWGEGDVRQLVLDNLPSEDFPSE